MSQLLVLDLNTADQASLALLLGDTSDLASRLITARDSSRFLSVDDAIANANLTLKEANEIGRLHRQIGALPLFTRR